MQQSYKQIHANLIAAKALIDTPEKWLKGKLSDADSYRNPEARCFCSFGAAGRVAGSIAHAVPLMKLLDSCVPEIWGDKAPTISRRDAVNYNDCPDTTHEQIMALWDRAIAKTAAYVVADNLAAAKAVIAKPEQWTQKTYARDADDGAVAALDEGAICFCTLGAVKVATGEHILTPNYPIVKLLNEVVKAKGYSSIISFNDLYNRKHEEVLQVFDEAIRIAIEEAQAI